MDVEQVIVALGERFDPAEAEIVERLLRKYSGTIPDRQLLDEIGLSPNVSRSASVKPARKFETLRRRNVLTCGAGNPPSSRETKAATEHVARWPLSRLAVSSPDLAGLTL